ncbi:MAG TPA: SRPBCC family protein [Paludibacter sp.]|nr:SRPBCC family protein [Paludibacter sp.]
MKILKWVLIAIVSVVALVLLMALFVKKDFAVEKQIEINRPKQVVYNYVVLLKNQNNFSKWATMDPAMEKTFTGTDGTVGFISAWKSKVKDVGAGEQEITRIDPGKRIDYELRFKEPMEDTNLAHMTVDSIGENKTLVKWGFNGKMAYPSNIMLLFFNLDKMIGGDFEYGLKKLKTILEKE